MLVVIETFIIQVVNFVKENSMKYPVIFLARLLFVVVIITFIIPCYLVMALISLLWNWKYDDDWRKELVKDGYPFGPYPIVDTVIKYDDDWGYIIRHVKVYEYKNLWHYLINKKTMYDNSNS